MTDTEAGRQIRERFGLHAYGLKRTPELNGLPDRIQITTMVRPDPCGAFARITIGSGPTWEHAIKEAEDFRAKHPAN